MEEKLKSVLEKLRPFRQALIATGQKFRSRISSFLKPILFGIFLAIAAFSGFNPFATLLFLIAASFLYFRPSFVGPYYCRYAFIVLLGVAILGMKILGDTILFWPGIFLYSFIFYLIMGIKEVSFIKRSRIYYVLALLLFYNLFSVFFLANKSELFFFKYTAIILAIFLILREWLSLISTFHFPKREFIASAAATFIVAEFLWATALLPIGFIAASNFMTLLVLIIGNFLFNHFTGGLSKEFLTQQIIFLFLISIFIFLSSGWVVSFV